MVNCFLRIWMLWLLDFADIQKTHTKEMNREAAFADRGARVGEALEGRKSKHGQKPAPIYGFARRPATATRLSLLAFSPLSAPPSSPARQSALPA